MKGPFRFLIGFLSVSSGYELSAREGLCAAGTVCIGNVRLEFHTGWPRVPNQPLLVWTLRENVAQVGETQP